MFKTLVTNNIKKIGIKKYSNSCNFKNQEIVRELDKINSSLKILIYQSSIINISMAFMLLS